MKCIRQNSVGDGKDYEVAMGALFPLKVKEYPLVGKIIVTTGLVY